jgi:hypothetical protein
MTRTGKGLIWISVTLATVYASGLGAQKRPDALSDLMMRQRLNIPTFGDQLQQLGAEIAQARAGMAEANAQIARLRNEYFRTYGTAANAAARDRFLEALRGKDLYYLNFLMVSPGMGNGMADLLFGKMDGGVAPAVQLQFMRWVDEVRAGLGPKFVSGDLLESISALARLRPALEAADSLYAQFAVRRLLDEHAQRGVKPAGWTAEAWRLALLARQAQGKNLYIPVNDPFLEAAEVARRGGFQRVCTDSIAPAFGGAPAQTCACLGRTLAAALPVERQWEMESADSLVRVLGLAVMRAGLTQRLRSTCGTTSPQRRP